MGNMKTVEKALEQRKAAVLKSKNPDRAFQNRIKGPKRLLELAENSSEPPRVKLEARRLYIVALCSAFEIYWRDLIRQVVDGYSLTPPSGRTFGKPSISLSDLTQVIGKKLTMGELISCSYTFLSVSTVNKAISDLFGIDAFSEFNKFKFVLQEVPRKNRKSNKPLLREVITGNIALKEIGFIEECFAIRHETVHHTGIRCRPSRMSLFKYDHAIWLFNAFFGLFVGTLAKKASKSKF